MEFISSLKNELIQTAKNLKSLKGRKDQNKILIEGSDAIQWAINSKFNIEYIVTSLDNIGNIFKNLNSNIATYKTSEGLMKKITETNYLIPVIAVGSPNHSFQKNDFIMVLDGVKDFGNIGTIVRTAQAFGITNIISTSQGLDIFQKKTIEASRGTVFKTGHKSFTNPDEALAYLKQNNYQIITTSPYGKEIQSMANLSDRPIALVVGNETNGASDIFMKNADLIIQIPMNENIESLNVGVATGISIYELRLKQVIKMIEEKIKSTLGREMNVTAMLIREALNRSLEKVTKINSDQLVFMMVLKCDQQMLKFDIQKQFGIIDSEFWSFISPLIEDKLITNDNDMYIISEKGIEVIGKLWTIVENTEKSLLADFTENEVKNLYNMLNRIQQNSLKIK